MPRKKKPEPAAPEGGIPDGVAEQLRHLARPKNVGRKRTNYRTVTKATQKGLPEGWDRKTFILSEDNIRRIDWFNHRNGYGVKEGINTLLETFFREHPVKAVPAADVAKRKAE